MTLQKCLEKSDIETVVVRFACFGEDGTTREWCTSLRELFMYWKDDNLIIENGELLNGLAFFNESGLAYAVEDIHGIYLEELMLAVKKITGEKWF